MSWESMRLGEFVALKRGYDLPSSLRQDGPVPVVSSSRVTGRHNAATVKGPGVVTGRHGTLGEVFFVREGFWPLKYVAEIRANAKGATYPEISKTRFRAMDIMVPECPLVKGFADVVSDRLRQMRCLKRSTSHLTKGRDLLLPRLMNGEIAA